MRNSFVQKMETRNIGFRALTVSVEFEAEGENQGVYYLKYCKEKASKLGISGWAKRGRGSVFGIIQGPKSRVEQMISWLSSRGPPGTLVSDCRLYNYQYVSRPEYRNFSLRF